MGTGSEQGEVKVLGWDKRRSGTEAELRKYFLAQLESYLVRLRTAQERARIEKATHSYDSALIAKHHGLIEKFLAIAERKVSIVDDYGDETWEALSEEVARCAQKIAKAEGDRGGQKLKGAWTWFVYPLRLPSGEEVHWRKYSNLCHYLESEFRRYHALCKAEPTLNTFDDLPGIDFETYLENLLKRNGFEDVARTPATGDQGADLLAKKDGRMIAIQAKRYKGSVGNAAVQEIVAALRFYGADEGWVITTGAFTHSARALAQANGIRLVDGIELRKFGR